MGTPPPATREDLERLALEVCRGLAREIYNRPAGRVAAAGFVAARERRPGDNVFDTVLRAAELLLHGAARERGQAR
jgi:hypothetical protein